MSIIYGWYIRIIASSINSLIIKMDNILLKRIKVVKVAEKLYKENLPTGKSY